MYEDTLAFQEMGAVAVEMECVPACVAEEITRRVDFLRLLDGQRGGLRRPVPFQLRYLGHARPPLPWHAKKYRDFFAEGVTAMQEYRQDVVTGAFPTDAHVDSIRERGVRPLARRPGAGRRGIGMTASTTASMRSTASLIQHGREPTMRGPAQRGGRRYDRGY